MDSSLHRLRSRFDRARATREPLVLATVVETHDSTYRKAGAQILIAADRSVEGLLSGGCLEADIALQAATVFETGKPKLIHYSNRTDAADPWGLQLGCEGSMSIWLQRIDAANGWEPLARLMKHHADRAPLTWGLVLESNLASLPAGSSVWSNDPAASTRDTPPRVNDWLAEQLGVRRDTAVSIERTTPRLKLFIATPPRLRSVLVVGGGLDARPLVEFGATMGWRMTVVDHREQFAQPQHLPQAHRVVNARPEEYAVALDLTAYDAAVVMSHHLPTDLAALRAFALTAIPYVGLLGPPARRNQLTADLGELAAPLQGRLRAPVGLRLGGRDPQSIALAIVAELQAFFHRQDAAH